MKHVLSQNTNWQAVLTDDNKIMEINTRKGVVIQLRDIESAPADLIASILLVENKEKPLTGFKHIKKVKPITDRQLRHLVIRALNLKPCTT